MSTKYPGGFISSIEPTVSPLSAKGIWTLAEALRYKAAGEWPVSPIYVGVQGVFATANVGQAESVIPVLLTGLQATGSVNDLTVIGSAIVALDTVSGTGGVGEVSISLPVVFDEYFNLNSMLLADSLANTFITDEGPNKFTITPNGDTRPSAFSPYNTSWSNYFDGSGDYLTGPSGAAFDITQGDFTLEAWVYRASSGTDDNIFSQRPSVGNSGWELRINSTNTLQVFYTGGSSVTSSGTIPTNTWTHVAATRSGSTCRLFINGTQDASASFSNGTSSTATTIKIGADNVLAGNFHGYISNARIVKGTAVYTSNFTPPTSPLTAIANTSLLTCQSNRLIDNSTNNFTITKSGDVKVTSFGPFTETDTSTGSMFDGGTDSGLSINSQTDFKYLHDKTTDYTIECWIYPIAVGQRRAILVTGAASASSGVLLETNESNLKYSIYRSVSGSLTVAEDTTSSISTGSWYHIAVSVTTSEIKLFINGVLKDTESWSLAGSSSNSEGILGIGLDTLSSASIIDFSGYISNLRIVKGTAVYTSNFTPTTSPLTAIANTSLLTLQHRVSYNNSQPIDTSGQNNVITRNGNASVGAYSPFVPSGWSGYFDGTGDYLTTPSNAAFGFGTGDFTVEGWWYFTGTISTYQRPWGFGDNNDNIELNGSVLRVGGGSQGTLITGSTTILPNTWYHIALVRSSGTYKLYLNGNQEGGSASNSYNSGARVFALMAYTNGANPSTGYVSNARIVKGTAVYTANFTPSTAPLEPISGTSLLTLRGPSFTDDGPNRFAITRNGDTKITPSSPFAPNTVTPDSYSVYFDGTGDYLDIASNPSLYLSTGNFTIEGLVYTTNSSTNQTIMVRRAVFTARGFVIAINAFASQKLSFVCGDTDNAGWEVQLDSTTSLVNNVWYHFAVVRDGNDFELFINGVSEDTAISSVTIADDTSLLRIGTNDVGSSQLDGYLSNLRIVKGTAVYTTSFTPPTSPLTAISGTSLLVCQSPTFVDNSTNAFALTVNGNSQPTKFNPFGETVATNVEYTPADHGGSVYFDGSGDTIQMPSNSAFNVGTGKFTMEFWVYPLAYSATYIFRGSSNSSWGGIQWYLSTDSAGSLVMVCSTGGGPTNFWAGGVTPLNTWTHVAIVRDPSAPNSWLVFVNGVSITYAVGAGAANSLETNTTSQPLNIGGFPGWSQTTGYISNFRFIKNTALYTAAFVPPQAPVAPIPATTLLTCGNNAAIYDYTGKNVLETAGNARTVQETPYRDNHSVYFDGSGDKLVGITDPELNMGSGDFTVEAWIYWSGTSTYYQNFVGSNSASFTGNATFFRVWGTSAPATALRRKLGIGNPTHDGTSSVYSVSDIPVNAWTHVAATRSSGIIRVFINGVLEKTGSADTSTYDFGDNGICIGQAPWDGANGWYSGYISNLRIVKGTVVYTSNFTPPTSPLTAVSGTSLLTCNTYNFTDSSTNNFTITRNGDARISSRGPFQQNEGDRCMYFDGTGDYVTCPDSFSQFDFGTGDFTIEFWVYVNSLAAYSFLIDTRTSTASTGVWLIDIGTNGVIGWGPASSITISSSAVSINQWYHVAVTRSGTDTKMFLNGQQTGSTHTNSASIIAGGLTVGGSGLNPSSFNFNGYIDDLRITKGVARYTTAFDPPTEPLPKV